MSMTWQEAVAAMEEGKLVANRHFVEGEFFEMRNGRIYAEDGCPMAGWYTGDVWQNVGWRIVEDKRFPEEL